MVKAKYQPDPPAVHKRPSASAPRPSAPSAPPLPAAVAKQYGLHHLLLSGSDVAPRHRDAEAEAAAADPETDAAVDDIIAHDSDALLAAQDAANADAAPAPAAKRGFWGAIKAFFAGWWRTKWLRYSTIFIALAGLATTAIIPTSRYYVLNTVGVRSAASVQVVDVATKLPLRNVTVQIGDRSAKTDGKGAVRFTDLPLGPTELTVKRVAFASQQQDVVIGWGSNPLGTYKLLATGIEYVLTARDFVSGEPVQGVEAVSDGLSAFSDVKGKISLIVEDTETTTLDVAVQGDGYRTENLTLDAESTATSTVTMVPAQKHVYISKQSGKYDVMSIDVDGKNAKVLLPGSGSESSNISLVADPAGKYAAVVSSRDGQRDKDGYMLQGLTLISMVDGSTQSIDRGAQIQPVAWQDGRLIYRVALAGASAANPQRYRLIAYNLDTGARLQLTSANEFTVSQAARGYIYYAASSNDPKATMGLFKIKPDGSGKKRVLDREVWTLLRTAYDTFVVQTPNEWLTYHIGNEQAQSSTAPGSFATKAFVPDIEYKTTVSLGDVDGSKALELYDVSKDKTSILHRQEGMTLPLRWLGSKAIVYRVATGSETADYVISPRGDKAHKIVDVTVSSGFTTDY